MTTTTAPDPTLDQDFKRKWVAALRSGEFTQGRYVLRTPQGTYCCLGVAVELYRREHPEYGGWSEDGTYFKTSEPDDRCHVAYVPSSMAESIGLIGSVQADLTRMNDHGNASFADIADSIENNL